MAANTVSEEVLVRKIKRSIATLESYGYQCGAWIVPKNGRLQVFGHPAGSEQIRGKLASKNSEFHGLEERTTFKMS